VLKQAGSPVALSKITRDLQDVRNLVDGVGRKIEVISKKNIVFAERTDGSDYVEIGQDEFEHIRDEVRQHIV
jgi:hypothetical protein